MSGESRNSLYRKSEQRLFQPCLSEVSCGIDLQERASPYTYMAW